MSMRSPRPVGGIDTLVYHVFVDRFTGVENRWLEPGELEHFAGGTFRGVIDRLEYIADLGVTAISVSRSSSPSPTTATTPPTTTMWTHVLAATPICWNCLPRPTPAACSLILDFVANHTSVAFAPFVEALNDPQSEYRRWFSFDSAHAHGYRAFFGVASMPQFDTNHPPVLAFLDGAAQHWLAAGADGLRLDYATGPSHVFWSAFRAACRQTKPDCWLFGEVTYAGDKLRTYTGRLDGCLDFSFCHAVRMLCARAPAAISLSQFANQVQAGRIISARTFCSRRSSTTTT